MIHVNPNPAEFLKWNDPPSIFRTAHYQFQGYQDKNLKLVSQQYRTWSDSTDLQTGLALYWWQRLISFSSRRVRVKEESYIDITMAFI